MRKYNPTLKGMVDNYRRELKAIDMSTASYTDEELYAVIEYYSGTETQEVQFDCVKDDVLHGIKR